ncbi:MAG: ABC transporter permease [Promethearchaeota archaeon]
MQNSFLNPLIIAWFINSIIKFSTPLVLAALGGMFSERSGVVNIGLEGMMLMGAFTAVAVTWFTNNPWFGLLGAILSGALLGLIHGIICVRLKGNQIVSGAGIILFATGLTTFGLFAVWGVHGVSPNVPRLPGLSLPWFGYIGPIMIFMFLMLPISHYIIYRSSFGLRLRASGEDPSTLDTAGVNVESTRMIGVAISGILAAVGGAQLSIGTLGRFVEVMTGGRGFIALAALIFGNWTPIGVFLSGMFFGFLNAVEAGILILPEFQFLSQYVQFIQMIPYISVIVALGIIRRSIPPKGIGVPYIKEKGV